MHAIAAAPARGAAGRYTIEQDHHPLEVEGRIEQGDAEHAVCGQPAPADRPSRARDHVMESKFCGLADRPVAGQQRMQAVRSEISPAGEVTRSGQAVPSLLHIVVYHNLSESIGGPGIPLAQARHANCQGDRGVCGSKAVRILVVPQCARQIAATDCGGRPSASIPYGRIVIFHHPLLRPFPAVLNGLASRLIKWVDTQGSAAIGRPVGHSSRARRRLRTFILAVTGRKDRWIGNTLRGDDRAIQGCGPLGPSSTPVELVLPNCPCYLTLYSDAESRWSAPLGADRVKQPLRLSAGRVGLELHGAEIAEC